MNAGEGVSDFVLVCGLQKVYTDMLVQLTTCIH